MLSKKRDSPPRRSAPSALFPGKKTRTFYGEEAEENQPDEPALSNRRLSSSFRTALAFHTTDAALKELFSQAGNVVEVSLVTDKVTGRSRGFAFVEMSTEEETQKAIQQFNGKDLDERQIKVNEARPREERPSGGGGRRNFRDRRE